MLHINNPVEGCNKSVLCGTESTHAGIKSTESALSFPLYTMFVQKLQTELYKFAWLQGKPTNKQLDKNHKMSKTID